MRSLVMFLTNYFLDNINTHLQGSEALYIAGGFWLVALAGSCMHALLKRKGYFNNGLVTGVASL